MNHLRTALVMAVAFSASLAAASEELTVKARNGAVEISSRDRPLNETWRVSSPLSLKVTCDGVDCSKISIRVPEGTNDGTAQGANARVFEVEKIPKNGMDLTVLHDGRKLATLDLVPETLVRQADTAGSGGGDPPTLQQLLTCNPPALDPNTEVYNSDGDYAVFVTNVFGTVLGGPEGKHGEIIDENDTVFVNVLVHPDLLPFMRVQRTSDTRTLGTLNIAGQGTTLQRQSDEEAPKVTVPKCVAFHARLTDFKAGAGKVRISAQIGDEDKELGKFEFAVSPIYHGMLSFGPFSSDVVNDSFKLVDNAGTNVIAPAEEGSQETAYAIWYTHFVWGGHGRDLEKKPAHWYYRINPSIGLVTNHLDDHALVGVSVDLGAFVFVAGSHFARTTVLSKSSGLAVGDEFTGEEDAIPTAKKWKSSAYYGVSVDLRAAAALIKAAFSGGSD